MRLDDDPWMRLSRELGRSAARAVPAWTEANAHDPGTTIAMLAAFLAEQLTYRSDGLGPDALEPVRRLARHANALVTSIEQSIAAAGNDECASAGLRRVRYFAGRLLDAEDLQAEQDYLVGRLDRRNRLLHGAGIVAGLEVTLEPGDNGEPALVIGAGLAFDPRGREIHLEAPCRLPLPASVDPLWVLLRFDELPCRRVPVGGTPGDGAETSMAQPTRIVETFAATLSATTDADAVSVARVQRVRGRWRIDARFTAPRVRR
jgi:hypothetical protein